tara:strand:- start:21687 stop:22511 length:825 start_codon:yes stop_codon:yes gene_type:complete
MRIAIQGIEASFHEMAAQQYFGKDIEVVECLTFQQLCEAVKSQKADSAVMAIENSIAGSLLQNYTLLNKYQLWVMGEVYINIQMHLMANPGVVLEDVHTVQSHPIALQQCAEFLWSVPRLQWLEVEDTALAAKDIRDRKLSDTAALASSLAAERFGLQIIKERAETNKQNFTRFLAISAQKLENESANKASLRLQLKHEKGSLSAVLNVFNAFDINLTKIQSVPIVGKPYEYAFHIDVTWNEYQDYEQAIEKLRKNIPLVEVMGEYEKAAFNLI